MKLKTFRIGGIHPAENKLSRAASIEDAGIPTKVMIPIHQNLGAPSKVLVKKGDQVKVGQVIAEPGGFVSAYVHSSVSGTVSGIEDVTDVSGYRRPCVVIDVEGDEWLEEIDRTPELKRECKLEAKEIVEKIRQAGIVGMGGAAFPAHVKLSIPEGKKAEMLILNGVECEPYLTADHRLMLEHAEEILIATQVLMKAIGVDKAQIGIENNKPDAIEKFKTLLSNYAGIEVVPLKIQYPQGGEKQLIQSLMDKEVPFGGLPIDIGAVVMNVGSVFAVYEAIFKNKPVFERIVTVTGKSVAKPCNLKVRLGTPISYLIEKAGGAPEDTGKVISGGPMMGKALTLIDIPVVKATSGVLLMRQEECERHEESACIRCGRCVTACSLGSVPYLWSREIDQGEWEKAEADHVMLCCECGACQYACPANIPLLDKIRVAKNKINQIKRARSQK